MGNCTFCEVLWLVLKGELPGEKEAKMIDALFCSVVNHQFIWSVSPAVRFVASCNPQVLPSVVAGILTAGENQFSPQLTAEFIQGAYDRMKKEGLSIKEMAEAVVADVRKSIRRIHGFVHPRHKKFDPRAVRLKGLAEGYGFGKGDEGPSCMRKST